MYTLSPLPAKVDGLLVAVNSSSRRQDWLACNAFKNAGIDALLSLLSITFCVLGSSLPM